MTLIIYKMADFFRSGDGVRWLANRKIGCVLASSLLLCVHAQAGVDIPSVPLGSSAPIPHNVLLTPSVEFPTIISVANIGNYEVSKTYVGYFDSNKCYAYHYSADVNERHFYPYRRVDGHVCGGISNTPLWSGNYLNWATTQTIDPFRKAMTGGYRVKDTRAETWLEKARHDRVTALGEAPYFPDRRLPAAGSASDVVAGATPLGSYRDESGNKLTEFLFSKVENQYNRVLFSIDGNGGEVVAYNPAIHGVTESFSKSKSYELYVRVKVCDAVVGLEDNCVRYSSGYYKPEGLIQQYSSKLRFGIFGYLNDSGWPMRDGGVLRANQKYVGPKKFAPSDTSSAPWVDNDNREWDPTTGVLIVNPNPDDAAATSRYTSPAVTNSGVINYLNKFGQMTTEKAKEHDPVSELYYAATRYLKGQGGVASYSALPSWSREWAYKYADGFPVVTDWEDPYQYWCQSSAILGIGDVNTWADKNLPGNSSSTMNNEPSVPPEVAADSTVDVLRATRKVFELEGIPYNPANFQYVDNSAYIAGLAYDNRTVDLRPALKGKQTVATYWVDVRERQSLQPKSRNQYWLAAKYGGFTVPDDYSPYSHTEALRENWWWTNGETLSTGDKKPDNFFVASDAGQMVNSLKNAFEQLVEGVSRSGSGLAANSTSLTAGTMVFQASYDTGNLTGELKAFEINPVTGARDSLPKWVASEQLPSSSQWANRSNIFFNKDGTSAGYQRFIYENLSDVQKGYLNQALVDYIRGKKDGEGTTFRRRGGLIGTIVNSQPLVVGKPIPRLYSTATFSGGGATYNTYVGAHSGRTPVVYVGANDGMLHGFNANTGEETYAFIPHAALTGLPSYASVGYSHRFFVDGKLTTADVYIDNAWKTVLVGTLGAGGRGVFALDVTDPANVRFLWEKSGADISALGNVLSQPIIAQVANGDWRVIMGNGPNSSGNSAQLVMISLRDGSVTTIDTNSRNNNGLSGVYTWDADRNGYVDTVYAGDLEGHLWRFTGLGSAPTVSLLFHAKDPDGNAQPITATPLVGKHKTSHATWVWFGTGRYITNEDLTDTQTQTWYGLMDAGSEIAGRSELAGRSDIAEVPFSDELTVRVYPEAGALSAGQKGWYADLPTARERMVLQNVVDGRVLVGESRVPDTTDPCAPAGKGYKMFVNPFTGGRLTASYLDLSRDGYFNGADMVVLNGQRVIVSGISLDSPSQGTLSIGNRSLSGLENKGDSNFGKSGSRGVTRSSWREIRRP